MNWQDTAPIEETRPSRLQRLRQWLDSLWLKPVPPMRRRTDIAILFSGSVNHWRSKTAAVKCLRALGMKRDDARALVNKVCAERYGVDSVVLAGVGQVRVCNYSWVPVYD